MVTKPENFQDPEFRELVIAKMIEIAFTSTSDTVSAKLLFALLRLHEGKSVYGRYDEFANLEDEEEDE